MKIICNNEILQSEHASEHGAYLAFDSKQGKFTRAGSASSILEHESKIGKEKGRYNGH